MFANSWITLDLIHTLATYGAMFLFISNTLGVTIAVSGRLESNLTQYCRRKFFQIPRTRSQEIWRTYILPGITLYVIAIAYKNEWYSFGIFLSFNCLLWIIRAYLFRLFPERGYLRRDFKLNFEAGRLTIIKL